MVMMQHFFHFVVFFFHFPLRQQWIESRLPIAPSYYYVYFVRAHNTHAHVTISTPAVIGDASEQHYPTRYVDEDEDEEEGKRQRGTQRSTHRTAHAPGRRSDGDEEDARRRNEIQEIPFRL